MVQNEHPKAGNLTAQIKLRFFFILALLLEMLSLIFWNTPKHHSKSSLRILLSQLQYKPLQLYKAVFKQSNTSFTVIH